MEREGSALDNLKRLDALRLAYMREALRNNQAEAVAYLRMTNPRVVQLLKSMSADQLLQVAELAVDVGVFFIDETKPFEDILQKACTTSGLDAVDSLRVALNR